jgi:hypothetical protein
MGYAIDGFVIHTRFGNWCAKEIKCLVFANLLYVRDSGGRVCHVKDDKAVVLGAGVKEGIIAYAWNKRVLVIVWVMLAIYGFNEMGNCVRFVGTKVNTLVSETRVSVQIEFGLVNNTIATIDAETVGLKSPITIAPDASGSDVCVLESNVKPCGTIIVFNGYAEIVALLGRLALNGTAGVGLKWSDLDVSICANIAPNDAIPDVCRAVEINPSVSLCPLVFYDGTIIEVCVFCQIASASGLCRVVVDKTIPESGTSACKDGDAASLLGYVVAECAAEIVTVCTIGDAVGTTSIN